MKTRVDRSHVVDVGDKMKEAAKTIASFEKKIAALEGELKSVKQGVGNKLAALDKKK